MQFESPLLRGRLLKRYKRFLADVELTDGRIVTAHCANTGAMTGLAEPGMTVWLTDSGNPRRKHPLSWEWVSPVAGQRACVNTSRANALVAEAIRAGRVAGLEARAPLAREVSLGKGRSRLDLRVGEGDRACYVEVKNVTLLDGEGVARFPDAVTIRGQKHLRELTALAREGTRTALFFCVARDDARAVGPAEAIDPVYAALLSEAMAAGVEVMNLGLRFEAQGMQLDEPLPLVI